MKFYMRLLKQVRTKLLLLVGGMLLQMGTGFDSGTTMS